MSLAPVDTSSAQPSCSGDPMQATIPIMSNLPESLWTLDSELDASDRFTNLAAWLAHSLPEEARKVFENADFHHKYQEQLIELLKWIYEHENENPSIEKFQGMLEPVSPDQPNQVRCPRRGCTKVGTKVHVAAHMLQSDHSGLPVYYCILEGEICKKFYHAADRDRHRVKQHKIPSRRDAKRTRENQQVQSYPYARHNRHNRIHSDQSQVEIMTETPITQPAPVIAPSFLEPMQAQVLPPANPEPMSQTGDGFWQPPYPVDANFPWAPIGSQQLPSGILSSTGFYGLQPWPQQFEDRNTGMHYSNYQARPPANTASPTPSGSYQANGNIAFAQSSRVETGGYLGNEKDPNAFQDTQPRQYGAQYSDGFPNQVCLCDRGSHACIRVKRCGCLHGPLHVLLTVLVALVFSLVYIYRDSVCMQPI